MASLTVHPLHVGTITRENTIFCPGLSTRIADFPLICWYIEGYSKHILVDTGGGEPSEVNPRLRPYKREHDQTLESALGKLGLKCEDIDIVIVSHLHWDHCAGNGLFPNAKIMIQKEELQEARSPSQDHVHGYIPGMIEDIDYIVISGDTEIAEGVKAILTPGHTHGLQGVLVEAKTRSIFIASDTVPLFKNIEGDPPIVSQIYSDLEKYHASMKRITELSALVLPGHDFKVFEREMYF